MLESTEGRSGATGGGRGALVSWTGVGGCGKRGRADALVGEVGRRNADDVARKAVGAGVGGGKDRFGVK